MSSQNLSDVLGNIGNSADSSSNAPATSAAASSGASSASSPASVSASASASRASGSNSASASASRSASGSNSISDAPRLGSSASSSVSGSVSTITSAPGLTGGSIVHLTGLPTLSGYYSYPPASVPPIANAPYMQRTSLPENFVFIIVGAVIAFVALLIIGWRVVTSWSINRRFRRHEGTATTSQKASYTQLSDLKQKPSGMHGPSGGHDMKDLGNLPRNFSSVPSLFFSPTAEVAQRNSSRPISRDPSGGNMHLPAGHYRDASRN